MKLKLREQKCSNDDCLLDTCEKITFLSHVQDKANIFSDVELDALYKGNVLSLTTGRFQEPDDMKDIVVMLLLNPLSIMIHATSTATNKRYRLYHKYDDAFDAMDDIDVLYEELGCDRREWIVALGGECMLYGKPVSKPLDIDNYQSEALKTESHDLTGDYCSQKMLRLQQGLVGLCGEAGECIDIYKKAMFQGQSLDEEHLKEELGDALWYIALSADALGLKLSDICEANIEKLRKRYGTKFDAEKGMNRNE